MTISLGNVSLRQVIGVAVILAAPGFLDGQDREVTWLVEACPECRIVIDTIAQLGDRNGPGVIPDENVMIAVDQEGRYLLASPIHPEVSVYSPSGEYLRSVGGRGEGPGEFQFVRTLAVGNHGELLVPDLMLRRLTVFDPDLEVQRTIPLDFRPGFNLFQDDADTLFVEGASATPELFGLPLHVLSPEGQRVRSFGEPPGPIAVSARRVIAPGNDRTVWIASTDEYRLELWDLGGARLRTFRRSVTWFDPLEPTPEVPQPPSTVLADLSHDETGHLWVRFAVPAPTWQAAAGSAPGTPHGWEIHDLDQWRDRLIEVVDPERGVVLASVRLRGRHSSLFGDRLIARPIMDLDAQSIRVLILRMRLEQPAQG